MFVNDVRIMRGVQNQVKLIYGHEFGGCPYTVDCGHVTCSGHSFVTLSVWRRQSTFPKTCIRIKALLWSGMDFSNAAGAVFGASTMNFRYGP